MRSERLQTLYKKHLVAGLERIDELELLEAVASLKFQLARALERTPEETAPAECLHPQKYFKSINTGVRWRDKYYQCCLCDARFEAIFDRHGRPSPGEPMSEESTLVPPGMVLCEECDPPKYVPQETACARCGDTSHDKDHCYNKPVPEEAQSECSRCKGSRRQPHPIHGTVPCQLCAHTSPRKGGAT
jgi:hypothetical protein